MNILQAIILGIVQGLTEFIPVSSSAHLVLIPYFMGWDIPPVAFDIFLHLGTLSAIFIFFWKDILKLFTADKWWSFLIILACIPTAVMGFFFKDFFEKLFENPSGVSILLLVTGFLLWISPPGRLADSVQSGAEVKREKPVSFSDALWIGFAQGCAIAPGISRSGATIVAGLFCGLEGKLAVKFSFLLSIPAILGALIFKIRDFQSGTVLLNHVNYWAGGIAAAISGYFAIAVVFKSIKTGKFKLFALYCWGLGVTGLLVWLAHMRAGYPLLQLK